MSEENPPLPLQGGDATAQPTLFVDTLLESRVFYYKSQELSAIEIIAPVEWMRDTGRIVLQKTHTNRESLN